jgi:molecular chaperone DnaK (HSP70)
VTELEGATEAIRKQEEQEKKRQEQMQKTKQVAQALDAVLFGSAEHQRRLADFREKIAENVVGAGKTGKDSEETQTAILTDIRDILGENPTVRVNHAGPEEGLA